jgi:hypothetical protein
MYCAAALKLDNNDERSFLGGDYTGALPWYYAHILRKKGTRTTTIIMI